MFWKKDIFCSGNKHIQADENLKQLQAYKLLNPKLGYESYFEREWIS